MIIAYYKQGHSKRQTANKFEIEIKQLRDWIKNKEKLMKVAPYIQNTGQMKKNQLRRY